MAEVVRAGLVQQHWTGDKESMIEASVDAIARAASAGAQVVCLQELFYGPYFCQVQDADYYSYTEQIPDGPTTELLREVARQHNVVLVAPMYEEEQPGLYYNTAAVIDADGSYLGKYRKTHLPQVKGFWEKFYFRPGNLGYPVFDTAVGRIGVYICYDRHFPEGWRALGLAGAKIVFNPSATSRGLSQYLWQLEQPAAAVANEYFVGAINRVGIEPLGDNDFYGQSYFADPRGQLIGDAASDTERRGRRPRPGHGPAAGGPRPVGLLPRPAARRLRTADPAVSPLTSPEEARGDEQHPDHRRHRRHRHRLVPGRRAGQRRADRRARPARQRGDRERVGGGRRHASSTPPASTCCRAASTGTRTWRCRSAGTFSVDTLRDRDPRRGLGRHHHDRRLRGPAQGHQPAGRAGRVARRRRTATAPSTTGST